MSVGRLKAQELDCNLNKGEGFGCVYMRVYIGELKEKRVKCDSICTQEIPRRKLVKDQLALHVCTDEIPGARSKKTFLPLIHELCMRGATPYLAKPRHHRSKKRMWRNF